MGIGGSLAAQDFSQDVYVPITTVWRRIGDLVVTIEEPRLHHTSTRSPHSAKSGSAA